MRCKKHSTDLSSVVGVCATCLRERLFALIAAQAQAEARAQAQPQPQFQSQSQAHSCTAEDRRKIDPPLAFPRSVSPYVSRRKFEVASDNSRAHNLPFYSTPQVGPTFSAGASCEKKRSKFSLFMRLFKSRSGKLDSGPQSDSDADHAHPRANDREMFRASTSWFSFLHGSGKRQSRGSSVEDSIAAGCRRPRPVSNRGMSPERGGESGDEPENRPPSDSGYLSETSHGYRRTPLSSAFAGGVRRSRPAHLSSNVSGMNFCLSPLVWASPGRQWNQKCGLQLETGGCTGEVRVSGKPHLAAAASYGGNRSRKLSDLGRVDHNR